MYPEQLASGKILIGLIEKVNIKLAGDNSRDVPAKIDTGATKSSIDLNLADELGLGPIVKSKVIKTANGSKIRPIIEADIGLAGIELKDVEFTLADRSHLRYDILIGQNILKKGFLIDPNK